MEADLEAVLPAGPEGLVLPKVESAEAVHQVERILDAGELQEGREPGSIALLVAIESPKGLIQAPAIAACSPRVAGLMFGAEDFGRELGLPLLREEEASDLLYARSALSHAAASAHVQAVDGVWPDIADEDGLWDDTRRARRLGFSGKSLIHPSQIEAINSVFSPSPEEVEYCRQVIEAFDEAWARGEGSIAFGGQLIDLPIVERARRTLALAEHLGSAASPSQERKPEDS
jgi:citrate lyase subunit beta/citryl-CoA lyase